MTISPNIITTVIIIIILRAYSHNGCREFFIDWFLGPVQVPRQCSRRVKLCPENCLETQTFFPILFVHFVFLPHHWTFSFGCTQVLDRALAHTAIVSDDHKTHSVYASARLPSKLGSIRGFKQRQQYKESLCLEERKRTEVTQDLSKAIFARGLGAASASSVRAPGPHPVLAL